MELVKIKSSLDSLIDMSDIPLEGKKDFFFISFLTFCMITLRSNIGNLLNKKEGIEQVPIYYLQIYEKKLNQFCLIIIRTITITVSNFFNLEIKK